MAGDEVLFVTDRPADAAGDYRLQAKQPAAVQGYHHLRSWALRTVR